MLPMKSVAAELVFVSTLLSCCCLAAQAPAASTASTTASKPLSFEVVSIRPSKPGTPRRVQWGTSQDGYHVVGQRLRDTLMIAYFPQGIAFWSADRLSGAPGWLDDQFDIDARVSEADLTEWQKQGTTLEEKPMFRQMLQSMLADRLHLVAHMVPGPPVDGWSLQVAKRGPHLTESKPDATLPAGMKLPHGGVMVPLEPSNPYLAYYAVTMEDFVWELSLASHGHPVQDQTGLKGRYDFHLNWVLDPDSKLPPWVVGPDDPDQLSHFDFGALGLRRTPIQLSAETLVIDHIEKPSEN